MVQKTAATVVVHRVSEMTPEGRKEITNWLRKQAHWIDKFGDRLAVTFKARYLYEERLYGESTGSEGNQDVRTGCISEVISGRIPPAEQSEHAAGQVDQG